MALVAPTLVNQTLPSRPRARLRRGGAVAGPDDPDPVAGVDPPDVAVAGRGEPRAAVVATEPDAAGRAGGHRVGVGSVGGQRVADPAGTVGGDLDQTVEGLAPHRAVATATEGPVAERCVRVPGGVVTDDAQDPVDVEREGHPHRGGPHPDLLGVGVGEAPGVRRQVARVDPADLPAVPDHPDQAGGVDVDVLDQAVGRRLGRQGELGDRTGRGDPADLVPVPLDEPHAPVGSGRDPAEARGAGRYRVAADGAGTLPQRRRLSCRDDVPVRVDDDVARRLRGWLRVRGCLHSRRPRGPGNDRCVAAATATTSCLTGWCMVVPSSGRPPPAVSGPDRDARPERASPARSGGPTPSAGEWFRAGRAGLRHRARCDPGSRGRRRRPRASGCRSPASGRPRGSRRSP